MEGVLDDPGSKMIFLGVPGRAGIDLEACLFESQRDSNQKLEFLLLHCIAFKHVPISPPFSPALLK